MNHCYIIITRLKNGNITYTNLYLEKILYGNKRHTNNSVMPSQMSPTIYLRQYLIMELLIIVLNQ